MQKQFFGATLAAGLLATGAVFQAAPAQAALLSCPANISSLVSTGGSCQYSTTYDNDNPTSVVNNEGGFFNITNWTQILKSDQGGSVVPDFFSSVGGPSGSFNLTGSSSASNAANVMLIFKSGSNTTLVGYLLNGLTGTWSSPFRNPPFTGLNANQIKDVSHISVYVNGQRTSAIPTPALLPSAVGLGLAMLRKRKQVTQQEA